MKPLILKLGIPFTIISFALVIKWWYVGIDGPSIQMYGFPLPHASDGLHTSMSLNIYCFELIIDLLFYFVIWTIILFLINRFLKKIHPLKGVTLSLWVLTILIIVGSTCIAFLPNNRLHWKRDLDFVIKDSGFKFIWQNRAEPELE